MLFGEKNTVETKVWLAKHYSDFAPAKSTVEKRFAKFKRGEMSTEDDARSVRPKEAVTDENIKKVSPQNKAYFEAKDKSYYKNGIEKLYDRYNRCIAREGNYISIYKIKVLSVHWSKSR